jgi:hypothetical protein
VHLLESGLSSRFIRLGFRYDLGPNAPYDAESALGEVHKKIHEEHEKGRSCVESSQARMERQLSVTTAFYSVEESIRGVWWTLIVAAVVSVFQADLRKIIGSLCGRALRGFAR